MVLPFQVQLLVKRMHLLLSEINCTGSLHTKCIASFIHRFVNCLPALITLTIGNYNVSKVPHHLLCTPVHQPQSTVIVRLMETMLICKPVNTTTHTHTNTSSCYRSYVTSTLEHMCTCVHRQLAATANQHEKSIELN